MEEAAVDSPGSPSLSVPRLLEVHDLTVGYRRREGGQSTVLDGVTFEIEAGEAVGLLGQSGSGKTTLGLALLGLFPAAGVVVRGSALFCGKNLIGLGEHELQDIRGAGISMVYQEPGAALNPVLRIGDQITEVIRAHRRFSRERAREEAGILLAQVGFPPQTCVAAAYPHQLSGGQQQRVAIAQAIAARPALLIADEPTTALDRKTQVEILGLLAKLRRKNRLALLLISHNFSVLAHAVDRILVIRDGQIVQCGKTQEIADASHDAYTQSLLSYSAAAARRKNCRLGLVLPSNNSPDQTGSCRKLRIYQAKRRDRLRLAEGLRETTPCRSGLDASARHIDPPTVERETLLFALNLEKRYRQGRWPSAKRHQVQALYGVELKLEAGSTLAVVGPSGSGKSTLARCLACLERPDCGEMWFGGVDLAALTDRKLVPFRRQIQMIFQDPGSSLNPRFAAVELISEPLLTDRRRTQQQCRDRALDLMAQVGLNPDWGNRLPHEFSAGQRRRLAIARALSLEPKLLILDEALTGLDRPIQAQIADLLLQLQANLSLTYVHISHDLDLVACLADRVVVLHQGQIVNTTNSEELLVETRRGQANSVTTAPCELAGLRREFA
jgi:peptide/nickel transport system ATP-binding protein